MSAIVSTEYGRVQGQEKSTSLGRQYLSFQGIPYMKAPLGKLRFRDPQPPEPWSEPLDCTKEPQSYCIYYVLLATKTGKEDAATINVYAPKDTGNQLLPVFVYIHGGGFFSGSSRSDFCGADYLMNKNVILVTFNYRLGPIGFLSLKDPELGVPGNAGLKDQLFALKWVQRNIKNFNGDAENVTICGESEGGVSVHLHMLSEQSKGLFHKAIIISGSAFIKSWAITDKSDFAERLAKKCGWDGSGGEKKLLEVLENANSHSLMKHSDAKHILTDEEFAQFMIFVFCPVIEPYATKTSFIAKDPELLAQNAWTKNIPVLIGAASLEGVMTHFLGRNQQYIDLLQNPRSFAPSRELQIDSKSEKALKYGLQLKEIYYKNAEPMMKNLNLFLTYAGDRHIWHGVYNAIKSRMAYASGKTFVFRFDAETELNFMKRLAKIDYPGASHGDMSLYLFSCAYAESPKEGTIERQMIEKMTSFVEAFMVQGSADFYENASSLSNITKDDIKCLNITEKKFEVIPLPEKERLEVWNSIFESENILTY